MFVLGYAAWRMGARKYILAAYLLMPFTLYNGLNVNLDWLVAFGFLLPPQLGLFLVLLKPQLGIGIAMYWFVLAFRKGGVKEIFLVFGPVTFSLLLSIIIFGPYFLNAKSLFWQGIQPIWFLGIPVAVVLLFEAIRNKKSGLAI